MGQKRNVLKYLACIKSTAYYARCVRRVVVECGRGQFCEFVFEFDMEKIYIPQPIDTDDVRLPEELDVLVEQIAKNVHDVWAKSRMEQGWSYGPERDDVLKEHPCLVPYEELSEQEKAYDRDTAMGTLKLICKLGFKITLD